MAWRVRLNRQSEKYLNRLDANYRNTLMESIEQIKEDPFMGDVLPLRGRKWKGFYRKRVGQYRIIFALDTDAQIAYVQQIGIRSEKTYR